MKPSTKRTAKFTSERFLRYPGSKGRSGILNQIRTHFPDDYSEYREPFCGSASVALSLPTWMPRWINDVNPHLMEVFLALKEKPNELIEKCVSILPAIAGEPTYLTVKGNAYPKRLLEAYNKLFDDPNADPALRYLFLNRCAFQGRVNLEPTKRNRNTFSNPKGWSWEFFERLDSVADLMADIKISCGDFAPLFRAGGENVFLYVDAPYICDTRSNSKLYQFGLSETDHIRLRDEVVNCKHKVLLSYDDHPRVRELYKGFRIHKAQWTYMSHRNREVGNELLITNYRVIR